LTIRACLTCCRGWHPSTSLQELRNRLVPTNDESLVRTIRSLLLNVDDSPMIPLSQPKCMVNTDGKKDLPEKDAAVADEETLARQSNSGPSTKERPSQQLSGKPAATAWTCEFSSSGSSSDSSVSEMEDDTEDAEEKHTMEPRINTGTSNTTDKVYLSERGASVCDQLQPKRPLENNRRPAPPVENLKLDHSNTGGAKRAIQNLPSETKVVSHLPNGSHVEATSANCRRNTSETPGTSSSSSSENDSSSNSDSDSSSSSDSNSTSSSNSSSSSSSSDSASS